MTRYEYDKNSNVIKTTDPKGNTTIATYDSLGQLTETTDALGNKTSSVYDKRGLVTEKRIMGNDGKIVSTFSAYDRDGRLQKSWQVLNNVELVTEYVYNTLGQVISSKDPNGNTTDYTYDYRGKVLSETKYLSGTLARTSYTYDIL